MIKVLFFAQTRELIGIDSLDIYEEYTSLAELRSVLAQRGDQWELALDDTRLLASVNKELVPMTHLLSIGDEVAFFPPVTGG
jgi:molybdopterin synthase sulfur carrier subunit